MDWQKLLLSPDGRIRRQDFWIGWAILFAVCFVLGWVPLIGLLVNAFGIYVSVCLCNKRLHDMGRTGWWQVAPFVISFTALVVSFVAFGSAMISGAMASHFGAGPAPVAFMLGGLAGFVALLSLAGLAHLIFLIWIGATPGQIGDNLYGSDPKAATMVDVF